MADPAVRRHLRDLRRLDPGQPDEPPVPAAPRGGRERGPGATWPPRSASSPARRRWWGRSSPRWPARSATGSGSAASWRERSWAPGRRSSSCPWRRASPRWPGSRWSTRRSRRRPSRWSSAWSRSRWPRSAARPRSTSSSSPSTSPASSGRRSGPSPRASGASPRRSSRPAPSSWSAGSPWSCRSAGPPGRPGPPPGLSAPDAGRVPGPAGRAGRGQASRLHCGHSTARRKPWASYIRRACSLAAETARAIGGHAAVLEVAHAPAEERAPQAAAPPRRQDPDQLHLAVGRPVVRVQAGPAERDRPLRSSAGATRRMSRGSKSGAAWAARITASVHDTGVGWSAKVALSSVDEGRDRVALRVPGPRDEPGREVRRRAGVRGGALHPVQAGPVGEPARLGEAAPRGVAGRARRGAGMGGRARPGRTAARPRRARVAMAPPAVGRVHVEVVEARREVADDRAVLDRHEGRVRLGGERREVALDVAVGRVRVVPERRSRRGPSAAIAGRSAAVAGRTAPAVVTARSRSRLGRSPVGAYFGRSRSSAPM